MKEYPEFVEPCPLCKGDGHYRQPYNLGCGGGMIEMDGSCDYCRPSWKHGVENGLGYVMKSGVEVSESIANQVENMMRHTAEDALNNEEYK